MATKKPHHKVKPSRLRAFFWSVFWAIVAVGCVIAGFYGWRWVQKPTSFPISRVIVQGQFSHVSPATLQKDIESQLKGGFFSLNLKEVRAAVEACPWVASVSFRRIWPGTLRVSIDEKKPLARFGMTGVLTASGQVFYPDPKTIPDGLPLMEGPLDQTEALATFYQQATVLAKVIELSIVSLNEDDQHSWTLVLSNDVVVKMGRQEALNRFKRFVAIYPKIVNSSKETLVSVDLRYPDGVAVQFQLTPKTPKK